MGEGTSKHPVDKTKKIMHIVMRKRIKNECN